MRSKSLSQNAITDTVGFEVWLHLLEEIEELTLPEREALGSQPPGSPPGPSTLPEHRALATGLVQTFTVMALVSKNSDGVIEACRSKLAPDRGGYLAVMHTVCASPRPSARATGHPVTARSGNPEPGAARDLVRHRLCQGQHVKHQQQCGSGSGSGRDG